MDTCVYPGYLCNGMFIVKFVLTLKGIKITFLKKPLDLLECDSFID